MYKFSYGNPRHNYDHLNEGETFYQSNVAFIRELIYMNMYPLNINILGSCLFQYERFRPKFSYKNRIWKPFSHSYSFLLIQMPSKQIIPFFFLLLLLVLASLHVNEAARVRVVPPEKDVTPIPNADNTLVTVQALGTPAKPGPPSCSPKC